MFDLSEKRLCWIPVTWPGLKPNGDDLAEPVENEIECLVELVDRDGLRAVFPQGEDAENAKTLSEVEKFMALVHDWRKVRDGENPVPFNKKNVERILAVPMFGSGFETSYIKAWAGQLEYREKNSSASPAGGQTGEGKASRSRKAK